MGKSWEQPDLTIVVYGKKHGVGKSALIGEINDFLVAHGASTLCLEGPIGGKKQRVAPPPPGRYHKRAVKVKIVEQWNTDSAGSQS